MKIKKFHGILLKMKELILNIGKLTVLRRYNRDKLAEAVGVSRTNLISALYGRRSLPPAALPKLRASLDLDETYKLLTECVHVFHVRSGEKDAPIVADVFRNFLLVPFKEAWRLRGIGEKGCEALAYAFCDTRNTLVIVQNDDARLPHFLPPDIWNTSFIERDLNIYDFSTILQAELPLKEVFTMLQATEEIWTWAKVRHFAEQRGITPKDTAKALEAFRANKRPLAQQCGRV